MSGVLRRFPGRLADGGAEEAAIEKCRAGDIEGLGILYELYAQSVFRTCFRILGSREPAEEQTHEVFLRVFQQIDKFDARAAFPTWLYRLAVNHTLNRLRVRKRAGVLVTDLDVIPEPVDGAPSPERASQGREARDQVQHLLDQLSPEHRTIIVLREIEELSYAEIAEALEVAPGTVMSRLHRARRNLQRIYLDGNSNARSLV